MARQRVLVLALCVLVMLADQAHAQGGSTLNENAQYLTGNQTGPLYHSSDEILARLTQMAKSPQWPVSLVSIPDAATDNSHAMFRIMMTRSRPPSIQQLQAIPTVFIICNQHAREVITAELCFWLIRLLSSDSRTLLDWPEFRAALAASPVAVRRVRGGNANVNLMRQWTQNLTTRVKVEVVPIVNIDGRKQIEVLGNYNLRKNPNGVDLNRNWRVNRPPVGSNVDETNPESEVYGGPAAFSEWETRSLNNYMSNSLSGGARGLFLDIHSGMWALMSPWSGKFDMSDIPMSDISANQVLLDAMQPPFRDCNSRGIAAGPGAGLLYRAYGSADDTAGNALKFRQTLTAEIYGPIGNDPYVVDSGWSYDCPRLRDFRASCSDDDSKSGAPCGDTACRNKDGSLMTPMPFMRAASLAAFKAAESNITNGNGTEDMASTSQVSAPAADPACPIPQPSTQPLNTENDPFMTHMRKPGVDFATFRYFNPVNAGQYRDAVARWCVGMLLAIDNFAMRQQQQQPGGGNVVTP